MAISDMVGKVSWEDVGVSSVSLLNDHIALGRPTFL